MDAEQARYAAALIFLERKMMQQPKILQDIRIGVERVMAQAETLPITHGNILANLGDLYHNTISTIQPRVMVNGEPVFLTQPENVNKIRALLLAGIRSCVLWRQCGGRRWKILLFRRQILDQTRNLLKRL